MNRVYETVIMFFIVGVVLSFIEALGGVLIEHFFDITFWDYTNQKYNMFNLKNSKINKKFNDVSSTENDMLSSSLKKIGYNDEQIKAILKIALDDYIMPFFTEKLLTEKEFNITMRFLGFEENPLKGIILKIDLEKRFLIMNFYNKYNDEIEVCDINIYRLIYDISVEYDSKVLNEVLKKGFKNGFNYEFISGVNKKYRDNEDLNTLVKSKKKKKHNNE